MRKTYSPEFKAKLVMDVFKGERLLNEIASENNVHPNMLLFIKLPTSYFPFFNQIKRGYSINYSDALSTRLFYPVPSVIITVKPVTKEAGTIPYHSSVSCLTYSP